MRRDVVTSLILAGVLGLAGCTSSAHSDSSSSTTANGPSEAAKIACSDEAEGDVTKAIGVELSEQLETTWANGVYSCRWVYPDGTMTISVADNADSAVATNAFLAGREADTVDVPAVGQAAYARSDGSLVVRKDSQILTIDVSGLPAVFGAPSHPRNIDAITVAMTILACWEER